MRIVHDIDDEVQVCGSRNGSLIALTATVEDSDEVLHIEGDPQHIEAMLVELLQTTRMLTSVK